MRRATRWLTAALAAALWAGLAEAGEGATPHRAWRRATDVALGGGIAGAVAIPLAIGGIATAISGPELSPPGQYGVGLAMYVTGYTAAAVGCPLLAAGSLAQRRVLVEHGARITPIPGALAWGTWGVTALFGLVLAPIADIPGAGWIGLSSYVASLGLGTTQLLLDHKALKRLPEGALDAPATVAVTVVPFATPDRLGLALAVSF